VRKCAIVFDQPFFELDLRLPAEEVRARDVGSSLLSGRRSAADGERSCSSTGHLDDVSAICDRHLHRVADVDRIVSDDSISLMMPSTRSVM
jgi:hypothetical protein